MLVYERFRVKRSDRGPLVEWMVEALEGSGCRMLRVSEPDRAPFRLTFETPMGERMGIVAYAFLANSRETTNLLPRFAVSVDLPGLASPLPPYEFR